MLENTRSVNATDANVLTFPRGCCTVRNYKKRNPKEATVKLGTALIDIFQRLEKRTAFDPRVQEVLTQLLRNAPAELNFSVHASRAALLKLSKARVQKPPLELEEWLEDIAAELYRIGREKHTTCSGELSEGGHVISAYLVFLIGYVEEELLPKFQHFISSYVALVRECKEEFEKYRPSEN